MAEWRRALIWMRSSRSSYDNGEKFKKKPRWLTKIVDDGCARVAAAQTESIFRVRKSALFMTVEVTVKCDDENNQS